MEASFTIEQFEFRLDTIFEQLSDVRIESDRIVLSFWIAAADWNDLKVDAVAERGIEAMKVIDRLVT